MLGAIHHLDHQRRLSEDVSTTKMLAQANKQREKRVWSAVSPDADADDAQMEELVLSEPRTESQRVSILLPPLLPLPPVFPQLHVVSICCLLVTSGPK